MVKHKGGSETLTGIDHLQLTPHIVLKHVQTTLQQDLLLQGESSAHLTLVIMMEGAGHFSLNQQTLQHYRPQSFWLSCAQTVCHGYDFFPRHHFYHLLILEFSPDLIPLVDECGLSVPAQEDAWILSAVLTDEIARQMQQIQQGFSDRSALGRLRLESLALGTLWLAVRELCQQRKRVVPAVRLPNRERRRLIAARDYIRQNAAQPLCIEEVAQHAGLSLMALKRGFRAMFAITPWNYVIECRLREAQRLLESSPLPLNDIALHCGFAHASHLSRFFHRQFGQTPGRYRNSRGQAMLRG